MLIILTAFVAINIDIGGVVEGKALDIDADMPAAKTDGMDQNPHKFQWMRQEVTLDTADAILDAEIQYARCCGRHHTELIIGLRIKDMKYDKILVPYDASEMSNKALERAVEIAKKNHSVIFIIHVIPEIPLLSRQVSKIQTFDKGEILITPSTKEVYDKMESDINSDIEEKKKKYSNKEINIKSSIKIGPIVETIVRFTKDNDIDIIVFSNKGLSGLSGFLKNLDSVSRGVAEKTSCDILIVR
jgi:nucleotide-binding universal stress UspA family protein